MSAFPLMSIRISNSIPGSSSALLLPPPSESDEADIGEIPFLPPTPTEEELQEHKRRLSTLAQRRSRRRKLRQQQLLEGEVFALRATVADLRAVHIDFALPPVQIAKRPPRSADAFMDPMPVVSTTEEDPISWKRQHSAQACWRSKRRRVQHLLLLEDEAADLKAEVAELRMQMSRRVMEGGARL